MVINKKIIVSGIVILVVAVVMTVGATVAFLTDKDNVENVISIGNVHIELRPDNMPVDQLDPGAPVSMSPYIQNVGRNDCFVKVDIAISDTSLLDEIKLVQSNGDWTSVDSTDFYQTGKATLYYNKSITGESSGSPESTSAILDSIELSNSYLEGSSDSVGLSIVATAIQTRLNGSDAKSAEQAFTEFGE